MDPEILFPEIIPSNSAVIVKAASVSRSNRRMGRKRVKALFKADCVSTIENLQSFSRNHLKISKAKRKRLKKRAKAGLIVMDKVVHRPSDAPPRDLTVKDEVVVRPTDAPPSFDEDLLVQDEVVDRLSDAPPSIDLACDVSVPSKELRSRDDDSFIFKLSEPVADTVHCRYNLRPQHR